jgi:hypothetical protein
MACVGVHAFGGDPEVSQFGEAVFVEQDVGGLDVAMDFFVLVQVHQTLQH